jgi:DNA-binding transcriptional regulator GbsR (MarR family)
MARRHVLSKSGVPVVAAAVPMHRDPLTVEEISTVCGVSRTSTSLRAKRCGTL